MASSGSVADMSARVLNHCCGPHDFASSIAGGGCDRSVRAKAAWGYGGYLVFSLFAIAVGTVEVEGERHETRAPQKTAQEDEHLRQQQQSAPWLTWNSCLGGVCACRFKRTHRGSFSARRATRTINHHVTNTMSLSGLGGSPYLVPSTTSLPRDTEKGSTTG